MYNRCCFLFSYLDYSSSQDFFLLERTSIYTYPFLQAKLHKISVLCVLVERKKKKKKQNRVTF